MQLKKLFAVLALCLSTTCFAAHPPQIPLKQRQPHWRPKVAEHYPEGPPKRVLFYEQIGRDKETPVKQVQYHPGGQMHSEMDLTVVGEDSAGFEEWKSTIVPHGAAVTFYSTGAVEKISFYDKGIVDGEVRVLYPEGQLRGTAYFKQGVRHGPAITYYKDGTKAEEVNYIDGQIVGEFSRYYPKDVKAMSIPYEDGVVHGSALEWHPSGALKSNRRYFKGMLHSTGKTPAIVAYDEHRNMIEIQDFEMGAPVGSHIKYHPNGKESYKMRYRDGKKNGTEQFFSESGALLGEGEWRLGSPVGEHSRKHPNGKEAFLAKYDKKGNLQAPILEYNEEGVKISEYRLLGDVRDGSMKQWHPNGNLHLDYHYSKGDFDGFQHEYFENGTLRMETSYQGKVKEGPYRQWYENGQLALTLNFHESEKEGEARAYFENGQPKTQEYYVAGQRDGLISEWFENGQVKYEGSFEKGKKVGIHSEYDVDGTLLTQAQYVQDRPDGFIRVFYGKDSPKEMIHFKEGKREGLYQELWENGQLRVTGNYVNDMLDGEVKSFHEDGALRFVRQYDHGNPKGEHLEYYPRQSSAEELGSLARHFQYDDQGNLHGEQRTFYASGNAQTVINYAKGQLTGLKALWSDEKELMEEAFYEDGKLSGRYFEKLKDGREIVYNYKDNRREGLHQIFYPPHQFFGKVKAMEVNFVNDLPDGEAIEYNEAGAKVSMTTYVAGLKEGPAKIYTPNGGLFMTLAFKNDKRSGPAIQYFPNGKVFREVTFVEDEKEGEERTLFETGKLAAQAFYKSGKKDGLYQEWNTEGYLIFEGEYKSDIREGKFNKYYDNGKPKLLQTFTQDKLHGVKKSFDPKGNVTETRYEMGRKL